MTNLEYIKSIMTDRDLANLLSLIPCDDSFAWRIRSAFYKWAEKFGDHKGTVVSEKGNPSIWMSEVWHYPDGHMERRGHPRSVAYQTWLCHQYDPKEWEK